MTDNKKKPDSKKKRQCMCIFGIGLAGAEAMLDPNCPDHGEGTERWRRQNRPDYGIAYDCEHE